MVGTHKPKSLKQRNLPMKIFAKLSHGRNKLWA